MTQESRHPCFSDVALVLAAGGSASRFGAGNKLFAMLSGTPVFTHCIRRAASLLKPGAVYMAVPAALRGQFEDLCSRYLPGLTIHLTDGGPTRLHSVYNALCAIHDPEIQIAAVQDAARPFLDPESFVRCVEACRIHGAALIGKKVCDTIKEVDETGHIVRTVPRERLWAAETPQMMNLQEGLTRMRHAIDAGIEGITDDMSLFERSPGSVRPCLVENREFNLKITYAEDLALAELYVRSEKSAQ